MKIITSEKLRELRPIIKEWNAICLEYAKRVPGDLPWWYGERVQIGFLAAAVWSAGGVALEEWGTEKIKNDGERRMGRGDLWLQTKKGASFHIEAKRKWVTLKKGPEAGLLGVQDELNNAHKDAKAVPRIRKGEIRIGILFVTPRLRLSAISDAENRFRDWEKALKRLNYSAMATVFRRPKKIPGDDNCFPGIAMLIGGAGVA